MATEAKPEETKTLAQAPAAKPKTLTPMEAFRSDLSKMGDQFKAALPLHVTPERFVRVVVTAIQQKPELLEKDRKSLYASCMKAAQDGLLPDGREAALVPFKDQVQYMPMVSGILKKVRNSGELSSLSAKTVHEQDNFRYWVDEEGEHFKHEPIIIGDPGKVTHVYACAKTKDGGVYFEVMSHAEVEKVRAVSKAADSGPWVSWWEEMAKKTVIRRLSKRLPMSTDLEEIIRRDDEMVDLGRVEAKTVEVGKPSRLAQIVEHAQTTGSSVTDEPGSAG